MPTQHIDYEQLWKNLEEYLHQQEDTSAQDVRHGTICEVLTKMEELQIKQTFEIQTA